MRLDPDLKVCSARMRTWRPLTRVNRRKYHLERGQSFLTNSRLGHRSQKSGERGAHVLCGHTPLPHLVIRFAIVWWTCVVIGDLRPHDFARYIKALQEISLRTIGQTHLALSTQFPLRR